MTISNIFPFPLFNISEPVTTISRVTSSTEGEPTTSVTTTSTVVTDCYICQNINPYVPPTNIQSSPNGPHGDVPPPSSSLGASWSYSWIYDNRRKRDVDPFLPVCSEETVESCNGQCVVSGLTNPPGTQSQIKCCEQPLPEKTHN